MTVSNKIVARCVRCRSEFGELAIKGATACPACGDPGIPMSPDNDVTININWHELRILTIWAEFWANHNKEKHPEMIQAVFSIAAVLQDQHPDKGPITFSGEVTELKEAFPKSEIKVHGNLTEGAPMPEKWDETIEE